MNGKTPSKNTEKQITSATIGVHHREDVFHTPGPVGLSPMGRSTYLSYPCSTATEGTGWSPDSASGAKPKVFAELACSPFRSPEFICKLDGCFWGRKTERNGAEKLNAMMQKN